MVGNSNSGRKPIDGEPRMKITSVRGNSALMEAVKLLGYSYSEVFNYGLKAVVNSNLSGEQTKENLLKRKEELRKESQLINTEMEIVDRQLEAIDEKALKEAETSDKIESAIVLISQRLYNGDKLILKDQQAKRFAFDYVQTLDPTGKLTKQVLEDFFSTFTKPQTLETYVEFVTRTLKN